jgi:hypothetical protein
MDVMSAKDKKDSKVESYSYKGKPLKVKDVWIRWLTQAGPEDSAEYGLRFFTNLQQRICFGKWVSCN